MTPDENRGGELQDGSFPKAQGFYDLRPHGAQFSECRADPQTTSCQNPKTACPSSHHESLRACSDKTRLLTPRRWIACFQYCARRSEDAGRVVILDFFLAF